MSPSLTPWQWLAVIAILVASGAVKGVIGMGLPAIAMALLALFMLPSHAAALLVVPLLLSNLWQMRPWSALGPLLRQTALLQVGILTGTLAAGLVWGAPAGVWASIALGVVLCVYAGSTLAGWQMKPGPPRRGLFMGLATGVVTAASGVFAMPTLPYLQSLRLERDALVQALGLSFSVATLALSVNLARAGALHLDGLATSCMLVVPVLAGMSAGAAMRRKLSPQTFRYCFLVSLLVLGGYQIMHGLLAG